MGYLALHFTLLILYPGVNN